MSAANYKLTLSGENRVSKVFKGAAADAGDLTKAVVAQQKAVRDLNNTAKKMGNYKESRKELAATLGEYRKSQRGLKDLSAGIESTTHQLKDLRQQGKSTSASITKLNAAIAKAGKPTKEQALQLKKLVKEQNAYKAEIRATTASSKVQQKEFKDAIKVGKGVENTLQRQRDRTDRLGNELSETGVNVRRLADEQQRLEGRTKSATRSLDTQRDKLTRLGKARSNATNADTRFNDAQSRVFGAAALVTTVAAPIKRAVDVESSVAEVDKVADFKGNEKEKFQSDLLKLGVEVNMAPRELADIAAAGAQSGNVKKADLIGFTRSTAKMAVAFDMSAESAGKAMIAWRDGMNLSTKEALNLMDAVNFVGNNTGGKSSEISGVLLRQGSMAKKSGLSPAQIAGLMKQIMGEESVGSIAPLLENPALLKKAFGLTKDPSMYKGSAEQEYQKKAETSQHKLGSAWRAIDRLGVVLGTTLLPATNLAAEGITWAADGLADLAEKGGKATAIITGAAAAFAIYKTGKLAKDLIKGKADQLRAGSALKVAKAEANLATNAGDATREIKKLNRELAKTESRGRRRGNDYGGVDGDTGSDKKKNRRKKKIRNQKPAFKANARGLKGKLLALLSGTAAYLPEMSWGSTPTVAGEMKATQSVMSAIPKVIPKKAINPSVIKSSSISAADEIIETTADAATKLTITADSAVSTVSDAATKVAHSVVKVVRPLAFISDAVQLGSAINSGNKKEIAETSGEIAGGTGGAWAGATGGAALGTAVFPGPGTLVGGVLGGIAGGIAGSSAGEWIGGLLADSWFGDKETGSALTKARAQQEKEQAQIKKLTQTNKIDLKSVINIQLPIEANAQSITNIVERTLRESINNNLVPAINNSLNNSIEDSTSLAP